MKFALSSILALAQAASMDCGTGVDICGVLTLESGYGSGVYQSSTPGVHGLWPETGSYGTSACVAASESTADPTTVFPCYANAGGTTSSILTFEAHEWEKHGSCAGVKDATDFFTQICGLASKPVSLMSAESSFSTMQTALQNGGFEIFSVDTTNEQFELSACRDSTGQWHLAPVANFPTVCGSSTSSTSTSASSTPAPTNSVASTPAPTISASTSTTGVCLANTHGPSCSTDSDCSGVSGCVRCAGSGYCTDVALTTTYLEQTKAVASSGNYAGAAVGAVAGVGILAGMAAFAYKKSQTDPDDHDQLQIALQTDDYQNL